MTKTRHLFPMKEEKIICKICNHMCDEDGYWFCKHPSIKKKELFEDEATICPMRVDWCPLVAN